MRNIPDVLFMLLIVLMVIFLWRQGEHRMLPDNEARIAALPPR